MIKLLYLLCLIKWDSDYKYIPKVDLSAKMASIGLPPIYLNIFVTQTSYSTNTFTHSQHFMGTVWIWPCPSQTNWLLCHSVIGLKLPLLPYFVWYRKALKSLYKYTDLLEPWLAAYGRSEKINNTSCQTKSTYLANNKEASRLPCSLWIQNMWYHKTLSRHSSRRPQIAKDSCTSTTAESMAKIWYQ